MKAVSTEESGTTSNQPQKWNKEKINLYDYFWEEVLPLAIQYGMSEYQFWHGDMRLLEVYQKAYYRDRSYNAWLQGQYNQVAYGVVMSNAFAKKGSKQAEYPQWKDPF